MLGFEVIVQRQIWKKGQEKPEAEELARWMTGVYGLEWLNELVKQNKAEFLGGSGYPFQYSITASVLVPILSQGLPANRSPLVIGDDYVLPAGFNGQVVINPASFAEFPSDEKLLVVAWDQS